MPTRYCIIGGGIAGTTAAETIRARDAKGDIILISAEPHPLYSRVSLPAYAVGDLSREKVVMRSLRDYRERGIRFFPGERVTAVDAEAGGIVCASGLRFDYDKLLIATGGQPNPWPFEVAAPDRMFRLHTLDDALRLREFFAQRADGGGHAVVAGGGFIALECAEIFRRKNFDVTLIVREERFWNGRWRDVSDHERLTRVWKQNGVRVLFSDFIRACESDERGGVRIRTEGNREMRADCVAAGIGISRSPDFLPNAKDAPSAIVANEFLETRWPNVWAAGDAAECASAFGDAVPRGSRTWTSAVLGGRIAGLNMTGAREEFRLPQSYSICHFDAVLKIEDNYAQFIHPKGSPLCG